MTTTLTRDHATTTPLRSPWRAAALALVTITTYGFWWWWDLNRKVQRRGGTTRAWPSLAAVTVGWLAVLPPFRSVQQTMTAIADLQRRAGRPVTADPRRAVRLAAVAALGLVLLPIANVFPAALGLLGWITPVFGMLLVHDVQTEYNRAAG